MTLETYRRPDLVAFANENNLNTNVPVNADMFATQKQRVIDSFMAELREKQDPDTKFATSFYQAALAEKCKMFAEVMSDDINAGDDEAIVGASAAAEAANATGSGADNSNAYSMDDWRNVISSQEVEADPSEPGNSFMLSKGEIAKLLRLLEDQYLGTACAHGVGMDLLEVRSKQKQSGSLSAKIVQAKPGPIFGQ